MKEEYTDGFFNVSNKYGFLSIQHTLTELPIEYKPLIDLCNELPIIKKDKSFWDFILS